MSGHEALLLRLRRTDFLIAQARARLERQTRLVQELRAFGRETEDALRLLAAMQAAIEQMERFRDYIGAEVRRRLH
uniref:hypothetical protein n=1 Tax=Bordetella sputigena TaxID=1416810 RepID=UPI0039F0639B